MWYFVVSFVITLALTYAFQPKPPQTVKPAGLGDIKAPTAQDGREIPVLFGCRKIKSPNVVWYGDLDTKPIKVSGGKK